MLVTGPTETLHWHQDLFKWLWNVPVDLWAVTLPYTEHGLYLTMNSCATYTGIFVYCCIIVAGVIRSLSQCLCCSLYSKFPEGRRLKVKLWGKSYPTGPWCPNSHQWLSSQQAPVSPGHPSGPQSTCPTHPQLTSASSEVPPGHLQA